MEMAKPLVQVKLEMIDLISKNLVKKGAIIFGGYVRDLIIRQKFTEDYYQKKLPKEKFYDDEFDTNTKDRLLICKDIDLYICTKKFDVVKVLKTAIKSTEYTTSITSSELSLYEDGCSHMSVTVRMINDVKFTGKEISVKLDITYSSKFSKPSFKKADMYCNLFIYDSSGIKLSDNIRTKSNYFKQVRQEAAIVTDMCNFTTSIIPLKLSGMTTEEIGQRKKKCSRVLKMQRRGWTIKNVDNYSIEEIGTEKFECMICKEIIEVKFVKLNCCNSGMHINCFEKYLHSEFDERITPRCPNACKKREEGWKLV